MANNQSTVYGSAKFGLSFRYAGGNYAGLEVAVMVEYGQPAVFADYDAALKYGMSIFGDSFQNFQCKVIPARKAQLLTERFVEIVSGRLAIKDGQVSTANTNRASYKRVMEIMAKIAAGEDWHLCDLTESQKTISTV